VWAQEEHVLQGSAQHGCRLQCKLACTWGNRGSTHHLEEPEPKELGEVVPNLVKSSCTTDASHTTTARTTSHHGTTTTGRDPRKAPKSFQAPTILATLEDPVKQECAQLKPGDEHEHRNDDLPSGPLPLPQEADQGQDNEVETALR
jgi:hypothetical protein